ncbi:MAG: hypothetical protein AAFZ04_16545 [Pseudomonadota bacterium]
MTAGHTIDRALLGILVGVLVISIGVHLYDVDVFSLNFANEDGAVEYATAFGLLFCSLTFVTHAGSLRRRGMTLAAVCTAFYALLFFMGAGEEVSWGQRIFGWESGEFFMENNKQYETNLHNLVVGDMHLAKTVFGSGLTAVILLYLVALPLLYPRVGWVTRLADKFAIPVPGLRHTVLAVLASLVIAVMDQSRKWEVYELIFSLLMLSIIILPQNRDHTR